MADQTMTLNLPQPVYAWYQAQAERHRRPVEEEVALALAAAVPGEPLPGNLEATGAALDELDDDALWRVSQSQPTVEDGVLLDTLTDKRRRTGLTIMEERLLAEVIERHDRVMVLRAEAIARLHARGRDISARVARA